MGTPQDSSHPFPPWTPGQRLLFRFLFAYLILYGTQVIGPLWDAAVPWVGAQVFGVSITVPPNGSGDTTFNYVQVFCFFVLAVLVAAVWSLLSRKRTDYRTLHQWLRVYVRFGLAGIMFLYGAVKVIPAQFPAPPLDRLVQPIGNASPMGLLWTFMGASAAYSVFCGAGEMLGGLLLTTRRTTLLGALVCVGVLANVVTLNFCYDVPVKLFSMHLLGMALFLAVPDLGRLADFFLRGRAPAPVEVRPLFQRRWLHRSALVVRTLLVLGLLGVSLVPVYLFHQNAHDPASRSPFHGIWDVAEFTADGKPQPPADPERRLRVIFDRPGRIAIQSAADTVQRYSVRVEEKENRLEVTEFIPSDWKAQLTYQQSEPNVMTLEGTWGPRQVRARLRLADEPAFRLTGRGFHWINEYPFNR
jgi:hypothetical protein